MWGFLCVLQRIITMFVHSEVTLCCWHNLKIKLLSDIKLLTFQMPHLWKSRKHHRAGSSLKPAANEHCLCASAAILLTVNDRSVFLLWHFFVFSLKAQVTGPLSTGCYQHWDVSRLWSCKSSVLLVENVLFSISLFWLASAHFCWCGCWPADLCYGSRIWFHHSTLEILW